jgi:N-acyl amino acid synthase of PEP-CTERM/exosortase system
VFSYGDFKFVVATSEDLLRRVQKLRYRIYVEECGFERPEDHPEGIEKDPYDPYSIHLAALNAEGDVVGTARLVLNSPLGLPAYHALKSFEGFNPASTRLAEISRMAVDPDFRILNGDPKECRQEAGDFRFRSSKKNTSSSQAKRTQSVIMVGLIFLLNQVTIQLGIHHWIIVTEKKLWLLLKRMGIVFKQIGAPVEYHGVRIPYLAHVSDFENNLDRKSVV